MQDGEMYRLEHYQLFLEHLAELHAASLAWEAREEVNIGQRFKNCLFELQLTNTNEWYTAGAKVRFFFNKGFQTFFFFSLKIYFNL